MTGIRVRDDALMHLRVWGVLLLAAGAAVAEWPKVQATVGNVHKSVPQLNGTVLA